ncbi:hypothetical protein COP1_031714 [Malus domestica]
MMRTRMIIRRKTIRAKVSPFRDSVRHRISRKVERVRVLPVEDLVSQARGEVEDLLVDPGFRGREILVVLVVLVLRCAIVVISDIMESVGEVVVVVLATLVERWDIGMPSVPRVNRDLSGLLCHLQRRFSRTLDQAVMVRRVVMVLTTIRVMLLPMHLDNISIPGILIFRLGILKILEVILHILLCQLVDLVDLSGIRGINPDREMWLLAVQVVLSSLVSQDMDVLLRGEVTKAIEVMVDDSKLRDVLITYHCKMLRTIQI